LKIEELRRRSRILASHRSIVEYYCGAETQNKPREGGKERRIEIKRDRFEDCGSQETKSLRRGMKQRKRKGREGKLKDEMPLIAHTWRDIEYTELKNKIRSQMKRRNLMNEYCTERLKNFDEETGDLKDFMELKLHSGIALKNGLFLEQESGSFLVLNIELYT